MPKAAILYTPLPGMKPHYFQCDFSVDIPRMTCIVNVLKHRIKGSAILNFPAPIGARQPPEALWEKGLFTPFTRESPTTCIGAFGSFRRW